MRTQGVICKGVCSVKGAHPSRDGLLVEDGLRKSGRVGVTDGREDGAGRHFAVVDIDSYLF